MGWPLHKSVWQKLRSVLFFYAHVHTCSPSCTDEERNILQSIPKQYVLLIIFMIML